MNFDFSKAINGEPIYCNGEIFEIIKYEVKNKQFFGISKKGAYLFFYNNGQCTSDYTLFLTTDPPKNMVKKNVYIYIHKTRPSYQVIQGYDPVPSTDYWYQCGKTEIEVEE